MYSTTEINCGSTVLHPERCADLNTADMEGFFAIDRHLEEHPFRPVQQPECQG
jgi:hypothetical protein